ncbi:zinc finger protein DZIP1L isoform X4 [Tyto alba]|uniref:zinc finger protein DZIP1L isoform X4 n=1 Tax=Tyto alba TaxID=56313 RepID=UPI001C66487E|nr:zinc finger protein DZIP1L isoform X4 [Tyto alba]
MHFSADFYHPPGAVGMPRPFPGLTIPVDIPPFHFQPRRASVDWRRFSAVDVERVAREVDVAALQEHIAGVTFCNLDGERCPHCGQPADPILLKVLRMAQLSIEYLLHCQERLGTSLATHARRLRAAHAELACTQQQAAEQAAQLRGAKEESRRWKKLMAMQQPLLQAGPNTYCKCHLCDKAFVNDSFLKAHVQRRHAEATEAERQKVKQVEQMEDKVEELKAKLREMQQRLEAEREAEMLRREQEMERARQREEEGRRDLERWKEEERTKLHGEIDGLRQLFLAAFKDVASRSSAMEGKLQELQASEVVESNLGTLQDDDTEEARWRAPRRAELRGKRERMGVQIKLLSASKPEVTREVTEVVADEESSDREEATLCGKQRLLEALRRNPNLLKQFRPILEELLEEKLESMGVKRVMKGISTRTYKSLQALVRLQQRQKAKKFPDFLHLRDELVRAVMGKVRQREKPSSALSWQLSIIPAQSPKSLRSLRGSQPMVIPAAVEPEASVILQPTPRSRAHSTHSRLRTAWGTLRTSKASSPLRGLVPPQSSEATLGGERPTRSPVRLSPKQEPALSAAVLGEETDSNGSDPDSPEETAGSGTAASTMVRLLERRLDAAAQRPPGGAKLFPAVSLASPKTSQPAKKLQVSCANGHRDVFWHNGHLKKNRYVIPFSQLLLISSITGQSLHKRSSSLQQ